MVRYIAPRCIRILPCVVKKHYSLKAIGKYEDLGRDFRPQAIRGMHRDAKYLATALLYGSRYVYIITRLGGGIHESAGG